jgi:prepilin-type N-terminal cleavage/methylation domain-containing protein
MRAETGEWLHGEQGVTLVELLVVMVVLSVIMLGLTTAMVSGTSSEVAVAQRQQAQQNARVALERMRVDIHCASAVSVPQENDGGGFTLTMTETKGICPSVTQLPSGVQWCTIPVGASTTHFQLFRETSGDCDGADTTLVVDYVTAPSAGWPTNANVPAPASWAGNLWPTALTCYTGTLPTLAIDLAINPDPVGHASQTYELKDAIAPRNSLPC